MPLFKRSAQRRVQEGRWVVVGLGNPGPSYERNRHNAGAMAVAVLLERNGASLRRHRAGCLAAESKISMQPAVLVRPTSFMNESGRQVAAVAAFYKSGPEAIIVVHDELDLPFGQVRVKVGGGTAGHNGLRSIESHVRTKDFLRVRIGISRPRGGQDPADYVLSDFSADQRKMLPDVLERAADAVERIVESGAEQAMNEVNIRA